MSEKQYKKKAFIKHYNIKLFFAYSAIILCGVVFLFVTMSREIEKLYQIQAEKLIKQVVVSTENTFYNYLKNMDKMAIQLMTNNNIKANLSENYLSMSDEQKLKVTKETEDIIMNVISPAFEMRRISVFSTDQFFSIGVSEISRERVEARQTFIEELDKHFKEDKDDLWISGIQTDAWSYNDIDIISLVRPVYNNTRIIGYIEIQQDYRKILSELRNEENSGHAIWAWNFDNNNLYTEIDSSNEELYREILSYGDNGEIAEIELLLKNAGYYYQYRQNNGYGVKIISAQPTTLLMHYYCIQRRYYVLSTVVLLVVLICMSWYVSVRLTKPLKKIERQMRLLNIDNLNIQLKTNEYNLDEMNRIYEAFNGMSEKLKISIESLIESKKMEFKAQRAALQSQISPHFIGNTLTVIGAKGYECGVPVVEEMCVLLSSMMRYISDQSDFKSTIGKEIQYTEMYMKLIRYRYQDSFDYEMQIDDKLNSITIPMLVIQPIVENSVMYGFSPEKLQLKVFISGRITKDNCWEVSIRDNGKGFSQEALSDFNKKVKQYQQDKALVSLGNISVGLFNSYLRLSLDNNGNVKFEIHSDQEFTEVIIGGEMHL